MRLSPGRPSPFIEGDLNDLAVIDDLIHRRECRSRTAAARRICEYRGINEPQQQRSYAERLRRQHLRQKQNEKTGEHRVKET